MEPRLLTKVVDDVSEDMLVEMVALIDCSVAKVLDNVT